MNEKMSCAISRVIQSDVFFFGGESRALKLELKQNLDAEFVVPVGNGPDALEIALLGVGVSPNDSIVALTNAGVLGTSAIFKCVAQTIYVDVTPSILQMGSENFHKEVRSSD